MVVLSMSHQQWYETVEQQHQFIDSIDWDAMEDKFNEQFWDYMLSNEPKAHNEEWMLQHYTDNFTDWVLGSFDDKDIIFIQGN